MKLEVIKGPVVEPVTTEEIKTYLHLEEMDPAEVAQLESFITAARMFCEEYQKIAYYPQTLKVTWSKTELHETMELPRSVFFSKIINVTQTNSHRNISGFQVGCGQVYSQITFENMPDGDVSVEYEVGKEDLQLEDVKVVIKLLVSSMYTNRLPYDASGKKLEEVPFGVRALLNRGRVIL